MELAGVGSETSTPKSSISINKRQKKAGNNPHEQHQLEEEVEDEDCIHQHKSTSLKRNSRHSTASNTIMASNLPEAMDTQEHFADPKAEIDHWKKLAQTKDQEIIELKSQLDKFQALFQFSGITSGSGALTIPSNAAVSAKKRTRTRLFGISAEPGPADVDATDKGIEQLQTFPKDDA